jgi:hypothetical protein
VYEYAHFHSTTHEVLGVVRGEMLLRLGGAAQPETAVRVGDVIVVPAGVSHMSLGGSDDVFMVGGYPEGRDWDLMVDGEVSDAEMRAAFKRIMSLPIPRQDPVTASPCTPGATPPRPGVGSGGRPQHGPARRHQVAAVEPPAHLPPTTRHPPCRARPRPLVGTAR